AHTAFLMVGLVLAAGLTACSGPSRSAASFCAELKTDTGRMSHRATTAQPGLTSQFGAALGNLGDFTRMLHQLDDRAPNEIKTDMDQTVKAWDAQQQALSQAAQNPVGAIVSSLASSLFSSSSIRAVDEYAVDNCGMSIFGTITVPSGGSGGSSGPQPSSNPGNAASFQCPEDSDVDYSSIVDGETTYAQLTGILQDLEAGPAGVSSAARSLADAVAKLSPPPTMSLEALARLRFGGTDPADLLSALNSAVAGNCDSGIWDDSTVNGFSTLTSPYPSDGGGVGIGGVFGQCTGGDVDGWAPPFDEIIDCRDGTLAVVDLTTGAVTHVNGPSSDQNADLAVAGDRIVWTTVEVTPAQGLTRASWTATLHIRDLQGNAVADKQIDSGQGDPPQSDSFLNFTTSGHILLNLSSGATMVDTTGTTLWHTKTPADSRTSQPTTSSLVFASSRLVDIDTGKTLHTFGDSGSQDVNTDSCGTSAVVTDFAGGTVMVSESASGTVTVKTVPTALAQQFGGFFGVTTTGPVVDSDGYVRGYSRAGKLSWKISDDIATRESYIGKWIVVTNPSGQRVLVDGATGKDVTSSQPDVAGALLRITDNLSMAYADPAAGIAIFTGQTEQSGTVAYLLPYQAMCG
ncbi:MAG TPA: hypothetical protein VKB55_01895, partial [Nocardioidaceae bacterium]|nr:hypothetical protein [Nocardioidaceae bacterium]